MDLAAPVRRFDRYQQRHAWLAFPVAVVKKFSDDEAGDLAGLIAFYGFFALFPLLLLLVSLLGFVLQGDASAQHAVLRSALKQFPVVGEQLETLRGSTVGLAIGLTGSLLSGLGVTIATQKALNRVYAVPHKRRPNFLVARVHGVGVLLILGVLQLLSTAASGLVAGGFGGAALVVAGIALSVALNLILFLAIYRLLVDTSVPIRELWLGIVLSAVLWAALQAVGGIYVGHVVRRASRVYGTFATVLGLLTWIFLGARVVVYAAEANVVHNRRLWPRSLLEPVEQPADRRALEGLAKIEERSDEEQVDVRFGRD